MAVDVPVDRYRTYVFPNRLRELRRTRGHAKLLPFAQQLPDIPYIRLSKIERGEVFARADELQRIAEALDLAPATLLLDVDDPGFDIADWAAPFEEGRDFDAREEAFAVLLGAALRARRAGDDRLSIAVIDSEYGLAPVNLSRIENAQKVFGRWNSGVQEAIFRLFGVQDEAELRSTIAAMHRDDLLTDRLADVGTPEMRMARTRERIGALAAELAAGSAFPGEGETGSEAPAPAASPPRTLPVLGYPLPDGTIAPEPTGEIVAAPELAGPDIFALRIFRPLLGPGLPAHAVVIVDPGRFPRTGDLAALRVAGGYRIVAVAAGADGALVGHGADPEIAIPLDRLDRGDIGAIVAALFV